MGFFDVVSSVLYPATEDFHAAQSAGSGAFEAGGLMSLQVSKGRLCQQNLAKMLGFFCQEGSFLPVPASEQKMAPRSR